MNVLISFGYNFSGCRCRPDGGGHLHPDPEGRLPDWPLRKDHFRFRDGQRRQDRHPEAQLAGLGNARQGVGFRPESQACHQVIRNDLYHSATAPSSFIGTESLANMTTTTNVKLEK